MILDRPERDSTGVYQLEWHVPSELASFEGHFPGRPILPAVTILDLATEMVERIGNSPIEMKAIANAKFLGVITPGMKLQISATPTGSSWYIQLREGDRSLAEIKVSFRTVDT